MSSLIHCAYSFSSPSIQALTSTALKKGGLSTGDVAALYKYKNTQFDVKVDTDSNVGSYFLSLETIKSQVT